MPRTVVPYQSAGAPAGGEEDGLPEKLVKYVPAEILAFFVPVTASAGSGDEGGLIAAVAVAVVASPLYLWVHGQKAAAGERPAMHFYFLAELALVCWLLGTSASVQSLFTINASVAAIILGAGALLIPVVDEAITLLEKKRDHAPAPAPAKP
jgi:uncharacterized membrane-anchored protein